jgi:dipeptidyl aminopeptidase/acylaminoacyl peptidase
MNWKTILIVAVLLIIGGGIAGLSLAPGAPELQPQNETLSGIQFIQLQFSRSMDADSVREALDFTPPQEVSLEWNPAGDLLTITPRDPWPAGSTVILTLKNGVRSRLRLPILEEYSWKLEISPFLLSYLWPADGSSNLYLLNPENGENQQLTTETEGVLDYSPLPDGLGIIFSVPKSNGGSQIKILDRGTGLTELVLDCQEALCRSPQVGPDGNWIAYETYPLTSNGNPKIQLFNLSSKEIVDLGTNNSWLENPLWSSTGWLSFYNHSALEFVLWKKGEDRKINLPNETGGPGSWSRIGTYFISTEIYNLTNTLAPRHLLEFNLESEQINDLTGPGFFEDLNPVYSPQRNDLIFARKSLVPDQWTPGRQIWILEDLDREPKQLTFAVDYNHTSFAWHPDGSEIAYVRSNQTSPSEVPELWMISRDGSDNYRLVINGFSPNWIR